MIYAPIRYLMKRLDYIFLALLFSSCGLDQGKLNDSDGAVGSLMNIEISLTDSKKSQARAVCDAMRSKRLKISGASRPDSIRFEMKRGTCSDSGNTSTSSVTVEIAKSADQSYVFLPYDSQRGTIDETIVQTDLNGAISTVCENITSDSEIGLVRLDSFNTVQTIDFFNGGFVLSRGTKSVKDGYYYLDDKTTYRVQLNSSSSSYGYVTYREHIDKCSGDTEQSSRKTTRSLTNISM